jgi:flagellin
MAVVNTNLSALTAQNALAANQRSLAQATAQLATGKRLTSAADDAAGMALGIRLATQLGSLRVAERNSGDGETMLRTADAGANGLASILYRMKELAVQALNDTNDVDEKNALNNEFQQMQQALLSTMEQTEWNGMKLLKGEVGDGGQVSFHVGPAADDYLTFDFGNLNTGALVESKSIAEAADADTALTSIDNALVQVNDARALWGSVSNRLAHAASHAANMNLNTSASYSTAMDADYAKATAELARALIMDQAGSAMLSQANQQPYYVLALLS